MEVLPEKVLSYVIFGALVQLENFRNGASGHFGFDTLAENTSIFERDRGVKSFLNGP